MLAWWTMSGLSLELKRKDELRLPVLVGDEGRLKVFALDVGGGEPWPDREACLLLLLLLLSSQIILEEKIGAMSGHCA